MAVWDIAETNKASRYPGVYVTEEVPCLNDVSCCETLERCEYICETIPECIRFHWYIEIGVFGDVSCDCFLMDGRYVPHERPDQAGRVQPPSVAGNRTEYSAVCAGDSRTTLDDGEFMANLSSPAAFRPSSHSRPWPGVAVFLAVVVVSALGPETAISHL